MKSDNRKYIPGSEWIYFKLYTGYKTADSILTNTISKIVRNLYKKQLIEKWFFIRYADPDFHIRFRILAKNIHSIGEIINICYPEFNRLTKEKSIWKVQIDTYNRELERYHPALISDVESIFQIDSESMLNILSILKLIPDENFRWMIALKLIDNTLDSFSFSLEEKMNLMKDVSNSYKSEFGFDEYNSKQFNDKFRNNKETIEFILQNKFNNEFFLPLLPEIEKRSGILNSITKPLLKKAKKYGADIHSFSSSHIHMTLNRLFRSQNRMHELILYDFMRRYYTSEIARQKYDKRE